MCASPASGASLGYSNFDRMVNLRANSIANQRRSKFGFFDFSHTRVRPLT